MTSQTDRSLSLYVSMCIWMLRLEAELPYIYHLYFISYNQSYGIKLQMKNNFYIKYGKSTIILWQPHSECCPFITNLPSMRYSQRSWPVFKLPFGFHFTGKKAYTDLSEQGHNCVGNWTLLMGSTLQHVSLKITELKRFTLVVATELWQECEVIFRWCFPRFYFVISESRYVLIRVVLF